MPDTVEAYREEVTRVAQRYLGRLAQALPTLCWQDEFFFFPRVGEARRYFQRAAKFEAQEIEDLVEEVAQLGASLRRIPWEGVDEDTAADLILLRQSMSGVLYHMGTKAAWRREPRLYLKAASLSMAPVLARWPVIVWRDKGRLEELLANIAALLYWGRRQVREVSQPELDLAREAVEDTARFFGEEVRGFLEEQFPGGTWWERRWADILRELAAFRERLRQLSPTADFRLGAAGLEQLLAVTWGVEEDLGAIAARLEQERREMTVALETMAKKLFPGTSWRRVLAGFLPPRHAASEPLKLYRAEVGRLRRFWGKNPVLPPVAGSLKVAPTPVYLRAVRATASYAAPIILKKGVPGIFYISPAGQEPAHRWRQHRFVSAHETYPGHHYLDLTRLASPSLVRRSYESPLFYEGWACYAETLLVDQGYVVDPREVMVGCQRRLWRALRGQVDLGLHTGQMDWERAVKHLGQADYPFAARQVLRWAVNPGYQVCYTLGLRQMLKLREQWAPALGLATFHKVLLSGGQVPFWFLERRLQQAGRSNKMGSDEG